MTEEKQIYVANAPVSYGAFEVTVGINPNVPDGTALLDAVAARDSLTADAMRAVLMGTGRLTLSTDGRLDYCTGQYFPTEYRKAAARALAAWSSSLVMA
jgi:hypothetical protein